jgi:hypothetical protein
MTTPKIWDFKKQKTVSGVLIGSFNGVGRFGNTQYWIMQKNGKRVAVWGYHNVKHLLQFAPIGSQVRITFRGIKKSKHKTKGKRVFDFHVSLIRPKAPTVRRVLAMRRQSVSSTILTAGRRTAITRPHRRKIKK